MGLFFSKNKVVKQTLDQILELSITENNTDNFFVLDYNSITTDNFKSKTNYSELLNTTLTDDNMIKSESLSEQIINSDMSSLDITDTISEWNTLIDLSKTIL